MADGNWCSTGQVVFSNYGSKKTGEDGFEGAEDAYTSDMKEVYTTWDSYIAANFFGPTMCMCNTENCNAAFETTEAMANGEVIIQYDEELETGYFSGASALAASTGFVAMLALLN